MSILTLFDVNIKESESFDVLDTKIHCNVAQNQHIFHQSKTTFNCVSFSRWDKKYFAPFDLFTILITFILQKIKYNFRVSVGVSLAILRLGFLIAYRVEGCNWQILALGYTSQLII